ncbi:MAG: exodeoxyribonuclease VII large subunit [Firmicutes bacterium]|nr:exodeoxyribonuclease VII large subunit [Bacillota bacterium]
MSQIPLGIEEPTAAGPPVYSVSEVTRLLKRYVEGEPLFRYITVCGEISNFKHHSSGHMYFVLKDAQSSIRCVMFRSHNGRLRFLPENGLEVYATGSIGIYETGGLYQLYVEYLEPRGMGDLHLAFQQLKDKLQEEGLFDPARKRSIPFLPRRVGVVTSPTGAAIRDIVSILTRRMPGVDILVAPAQVQGREAAASIVAALEALTQWGEVDVIILGRGGGSLEDLWPFNEELVARAVYACPVPIISAVGHETDITICDFVADLRAPTPSGAAELAVPVTADLQAGLGEMETRLHRALLRGCQHKRERITHLGRMLKSYSPDDMIRQKRQRLDELTPRLLSAVQRHVASEKRELEMVVQRLDNLSPLSVLTRGYAIARDSVSMAPIVSVTQANTGMGVDVLLQDGILQVEVRHVEKGGNHRQALAPNAGEEGED